MAGLWNLITGNNPGAKAANAAAAQATGAQNQIIQQLLPVLQQQLGNYENVVQPLQAPLAQGFENLLGQTTSGNTQLAHLTPTVIQQLLSGGVTGAGVGQDVLGYYQNQMHNGGIAPSLVQSALGSQQQGFDQRLNDIRNMLGGTTTEGARLEDLTLNQNMAQAQLLAQLTGQSQQLRDQAAGNALGAAQGIDQQTVQRLLSALGAGGNVDEQTLQNLLSIGNYGAQAQQGSLSQYLGGMTNLANQYGGAANQAATNAQSAYNTQQSQLGGLLGAGAQAYGAGLGARAARV